MKKRGMMIGLLAVFAAGAYGLGIGDKAPGLDGVKTWLNGDAVAPDQADGKTVFVVEFWATWCGPCRTTIPHLNKLHDEFKDKGVVIAGISTEPEATVKPFAEQMTMRYRIGIDPKETTDATWMKDVNGIPHAFVVGNDGRILWEGHPMAGLDRVLADVVAGTYDPEKAKQQQSGQDRLMKLLGEGDFEAALTLLDRMTADDPKNLELQMMKGGLLMQTEQHAALKQHFAGLTDIFADNPQQLNTIAWMMLSAPYPVRDLPVIWKAATVADEATGHADPAILDTLALATYQLGELEKALALQEEALARCEDAEIRQQMESMRDYYKSAIGLRDRLRARPAP